MVKTAKSRDELWNEVQSLQERLAQLSQGDLAQRLHFLESLIEAIPHPIYYKDTAGVYIGCNSAFAEQVMGLPRERIIEHTIHDLAAMLAQDIGDLYRHREVDPQTSPDVQAYEASVEFADGAYHQVLVNEAALTDMAGDLSGKVGILLDVTDIRRQDAERATLLQDAQRRAMRLQTAAEVSRAASSLLSLDELLTQSVELIRERFRLYYVGLFLLDDRGAWAVLKAGTGEAGQRMLHDQHRLRVGGDSMIGTCVAKAEPLIAHNVDNAAARFVNPLLPRTRSEMALPLVSRGHVIGAMTIQSEVEGAYTEEDITVLQTMADQLANAIQNARLFERMDHAVRENEILYNMSATMGNALTIPELVRGAADVAGFIGMDSVDLNVFTRWDDEGMPLIMDAYRSAGRSTSDEIIQRVGEAASEVLVDGLFTERRQILICEDLEALGASLPDALRSSARAQEYRSLVMAPLVSGQRRQGMLTLMGESPLSSGADERRIQIFVRALTDQIASALDRQFLLGELERRAMHLTVASEISRASSSYLDPERLLSESVRLIHEGFNLHYVGIFLLDDSGQWAVLRAGTGEMGRRMMEDGYRYRVDDTSRVGASILTRTAMIGGDAGEHAHLIGLEPVPDGPSEIALPLISRGFAIGAILVQSAATTAFSEDEITIFTTMADQLANAIANAQLYETSQANLEELQRLQQRYALDMWDEYVEREDVVGYSYDLNKVTPLMSFEQMTLPSDDGEVGLITQPGVEGGDGAALMQTLEIRGESVGLMSFEEPAAAVDWTEDQIEVLRAVHEQLELALENRLLIDRSQRALREARQREAELEFLQEVSALLNATNDVMASREDLMARLQAFVPVSHLAFAGYMDDDRFALIGGVGEGLQVYQGQEPNRWQSSAFEWVIDRQEIVHQDDLRLTASFPEDEDLAAVGVLSRLLLPLRLGYRILGVMELGSPQVGAFARPGLMPILQQVAAQVASAIERGNLLGVAQASAEESQRLYEATSDLAEATDAQAVLEAIAQHGFANMPAEAMIGLYVTDPETGAPHDWLEIAASLSDDVGEAVPAGTRLRSLELASLELLGNEQLFVCEDVAQDRRLSPDVRDAYLTRGVHAVIVTTLSTGLGASERIGVLEILLRQSYEVTEQDLRLYHTISDQAAVVLSNRQLFRESQARIERQAIAVELANLTTSQSERELLLQASVDFLTDRFDLYFAGLFMLDDQGDWVVLEAGTGEVGERLMLMGHRLRVGGHTMVGQSVQKRQRVLSLDLGKDDALLENPLLPDTRSTVVFPLISRGQINGAISLQSRQRFAFTEDDIATLELMVNQLANVIESTNLYERSQSSLAETRMLYRIAQQITDSRDAQAVLKAAVDGISQRAEPDWVIAGLLEPQDQPTVLHVAVTWSREGGALPILSFPLDQVQQWYDVLSLDERFVTPDITQDPMVDDFLRKLYGELGLRATAAFQLKVRGAQYGTILVHSENAREFSTAELSFYENVARQAFVALENLSLVEATREQAERRDILNQVLQTASSSLEEEVILSDVGRVIAERLNMPVMMWHWDGMAVQAVAVHDAGGITLMKEGGETGVSSDLLAHIYNVIETREASDIVLEARDGAFRHLDLGLKSDLVEGYAVPLTARDVIYGVILLGRQQLHDPIDDMEREFLRTVGTNVSVAMETASLYRDAQETAEKLKEVDELKNQFMANMSHELRTPLNSIIGFSRVMLKGIDGPLTDMQQTDLNAIYESGRHLLDLINDILDISKINAGKMEIVFEPVDLQSMIKSVMSTALGFVKDKPVELLTDMPDNLPHVIADARRIRQVLTNLIGNAGKFTDEGFIKIAATYDDYQVILSVQDTGIGIPPDRVHAVFEQFEQVDSSSTRRYGGTGLGVPLSREFVRIHGGDMWIQETAVGKGTTFSFSLPIGGPDAAGKEEPDEDAVSKVILTVDDDEGVVTLFRRYLEKQGYQVFGLTNSDRVIEEAKRLKPHAITLDVIMPGRDGWAVIQALKSDPETRDIPVIICSILGDRDKGLSMGVADYLIKPISERQLLRALDRVDGDVTEGYVLVVDDNADDRKLLCRILESAHYQVTEAAGGAAAIDCIRETPPMLVVLDLMMPDVDGFAVLERLKANRATRQIPVVVVTAKELGSSERNRLQERVESLLQKGLFDQQQLLNDVKDALARLSRRGTRTAP